MINNCKLHVDASYESIFNRYSLYAYTYALAFFILSYNMFVASIIVYAKSDNLYAITFKFWIYDGV